MNWITQARSRSFHAPRFRFASGEALDLDLHCFTLGSEDAASVVLLLHGTTGDATQFLQPGMADLLFAPGGPLDLDRHFVLLPDAIGHGRSSKPSDGLGSDFPRYRYGDIVRAQHLVVSDHLRIEHLRLVLGASMGGMQTWMWGESFPDMMDALLPIACLPEPITGRNLWLRRVMVEMIRSAPDDAPGEVAKRLGLAWNMFKMLTSSLLRLASELPDTRAADAHIREIAAQAIATKDPHDAIRELEASLDYDPTAGLSRIAAPLFAVNFADDEINPAALGSLERALLNVRNGRAVNLPAGPKSQGHQTWQLAEVWGHCVTDLLERAPRRRS